MDTERIKKIQKYFVYGFLALSFLLASPEVAGARKFFISLFWVLLVFYETSDLMPNRKGWRDFTRILIILLVAPLAVIFVLAGGDAVIKYLSSPAANESAQVIQMAYREMFKVFPAVLSMWRSGDLRQLNGNFNWFYFVIMSAVAYSLVRLVWTWVHLLIKAARDRGLHRVVVSQPQSQGSQS